MHDGVADFSAPVSEVDDANFDLNVDPSSAQVRELPSCSMRVLGTVRPLSFPFIGTCDRA